jgi:DNA-binding YbaB/EbfC family protein
MPDDEQIDFTELARRARQMQQGLRDATGDLTAIQATGQGGGGLVTATVSGDGRVLDLKIDPSVIDPDDPQTLADLVIAAVEGANQAVKEQRAERLTELTGGASDLLAGLRRERPRPNLVSRRVPGPPGGPAGRPGMPS